MKIFLLFLGALWCAAGAFGQGLPDARQSSPLAYVFQLTPDEAAFLTDVDGLYGFKPDMLHTKIDSFPADSTYYGLPDLPFGHFLIAKTVMGNLSLEWLEKPYTRASLQNNAADLNLLVANPTGQSLSHASVKMGKKTIPYDPVTGYFRLPRTQKDGLLRIEADGHTDFIRLSEQYNSRGKKTINRIIFGIPLGYVTAPVRKVTLDVVHSIKWGYPQGVVERIRGIFSEDYRNEYRYQSRFHGYVVTDKPMYRTNDTVQVAAWLVKGKQETPYRKPLELTVSHYDRVSKMTRFDTLAPLRPGSYVATWVLADSLDFRLDTSLEIALRRKGKTVKTTQVRYADYYLPKTIFTAELDKEKHVSGEQAPKLNLKAQDTNEQWSPDGQVELWMFPVNPGDFEEMAAFVPDTLWHHQLPLLTDKLTDLSLPDTLFGAYSFSYEITCVYTNSENERRMATVKGRYDRKTLPFAFDFQKDTLAITFSPARQGTRAPVQLTLNYGRESEVLGPVNLPYKLPVSPYLTEVQVAMGNLEQVWHVPDASVALVANRAKRELTLIADNPHLIPFRYHLYRGNREIGRGQTTEWGKALKTKPKGRYFGSIQYVWKGVEKTLNYQFPYASNNLQITWDAPSVIEPGATFPLMATVTDYRGRPVPAASVQLWGNNKQFDSHNLPGFQAKPLRQKDRKQIRNFSFSTYGKVTKREVQLQAAWLRLFQLDTAEFYRFLYPMNGLYQTYLHQSAAMGELAPYVVCNGKLEKVHLIWANDQLIYFSGASDARYVFPLPEGRYDLRLRTSREEIRVFDREVRPHHRTILSIDAENLPKGALKYVRGRTMTPEEYAELTRKLVLINNTFPNKMAYLRQGQHFHPLSSVGSVREQPVGWRVGPLQLDSATFHLPQGFQTTFLAEPDYVYSFRPGILKVEKDAPSRVLPAKYPLIGTGVPRLRDQLITPEEAAKWNNEEEPVGLPAFQLLGEWPAASPEQGKLKWETPNLSDKWAADRWILMEVDSGWVNSYRRLPNQLPVGRYTVFLRNDTGEWVRLDTASIRANGLNFKRLTPDTLWTYQPIKPALTFHDDKRLSFRDTIMAEGEFAGEVRGFIWNEWGIPIAGATVCNAAGKLLTHSQPDGSFRVKTAPDTRLRIETPYFEPLEATARVGAEWQVTFGRYRQTANGTVLQPIEVWDSVKVMRKSVVSASAAVSGYPSGKVYATGNTPSGSIKVIGKVTDGEDGEGLPGVNVIVKGTSLGTVTDMEGNYQLWVPAGSMLAFHYIGYAPQEYFVAGGRIDAMLEADINALEEVVVVGYGGALMGRVAGVQVAGGNPAAGLMIRGASSISEAKTPLVIVDGVPYTGRFEDLSLAQIASIEVLKDEAAINLYGSNAANGVTIITTKNAMGLETGNPEIPPQVAVRQTGALRSRFSDVAFWAPQLRTDRQGKAQVEVTFPDNLNGWRLMAIASKGEQAALSVRNLFARKQVAATLAIPRFLVQGDTAFAIGRALNYTPDSLPITTQFRGAVMRSMQLGPSFTETFPLVAADTGKLSLTYTLTREDGAFDGEEQSLNVLPKGLERLEGWFAQLANDTVVELSVPAGGAPLLVGLQATPLQVLLEEIYHLKNYRYACNEQLASRLLAYLYEEQIAQATGQRFRGGKEVRQLIALLEKNREQNGQWGWWPGTPFHPFISAHVLKALALAAKMGYEVSGLQEAERSILQQFVRCYAYEKTAVLKTLIPLNPSGTYWKGFVQELEKDTTHTLVSWVEMQQLRQQVGLPVQTDTLRKLAKTGILGEMYWEEPNAPAYSWMRNNRRTTLQVYELIRQDTAWQADLPQIWQYFLKQRGSGYWGNTFESAEIMGAFLPDFLQDQTYQKDSSVRVSGEHTFEMGQQPESFRLSEGQSVKIAKTGPGYLYLSAVAARFEADPPARSGDFQVATRWAGQSATAPLKATMPATLEVTVEAAKSSEYVMLEVPIPAGCLYNSDARFSGPHITHQEAYRDRTILYCERLPAGKHVFSIPLIPTFTGSYTLNPAQVQLMYFTTFQANNRITKVAVE
jgi:TonB-dependent SusC/RagA subfamily outer membrane receptor